MIKNKNNSDGSTVHVMMSNPLYIRKEVLKTAIDTTKLLKYFEDIKGVRERKVVYIEKLSNNLNDAWLLTKKFHEVLPKAEEEKKEIKHEIKPEGKKPIKIIKIKEVKAQPKSKIDLELESIEERLRNIKI